MSTFKFSRRMFLAGAAALAAIPGLNCLPRPAAGEGIIVYRRSGKGLHLSRAALRHAANRLYQNCFVAQLDQAHPGDNAKVVEITISRARYDRLFGRGRLIVDLRRDA